MEHGKVETMKDFFQTRADTYDKHMIESCDLSIFYKDISKSIPEDKKINHILDLGCGTGLELEHIFLKYPNLKVTGVDLSENMLNELNKKYKQYSKQIQLECNSYFEFEYSKEYFDLVISTYSFHHFEYNEKLKLYNKIFYTLKNDGIFIEGDYISRNFEEENNFLNNYKIKSSNYTDELIHVDIPFTVETQLKLYKDAGFKNITVYKKYDTAAIFICEKL
jgi:tRNA (cmo5U34)-methyltransferase